jgi:hypothetical protein
LFIVGNLSRSRQDLAKNGSNPITKGFFLAVHYIVPNVRQLPVCQPAGKPESPGKVRGPVPYPERHLCLVYAGVLMILAILAFDRREVY